MAIDLFDTRTMLGALRQMKPARRFLLDMFFRIVTESMTKAVDIDIVKGKRKMAPFVSPMHEGQMVDRLGYTTETYEPPYIKPKMVTTAQDFLTRLAGETMYAGGESSMDRALAQLGKDMAYLDDIISRREEWMAAQILQTGEVVVSGDGISKTISFGIEGSHIITLSGNDLWSDTTNATPLEDLRTWRRLIAKDSGIVPNTVVMGSDAVDAFLKHPNVKDQLDTRRINLGEIDPSEYGNGAIHYGRIKDVGVELYSYDEWYLADGTGTETAMVDPTKVIMGSTNARAERHYGAIQDVEFDGLASVARWPKSWVEKDPSARFLMVQSAPLPCLHQIDSLVCAKVLA